MRFDEIRFDWLMPRVSDEARRLGLERGMSPDEVERVATRLQADFALACMACCVSEMVCRVTGPLKTEKVHIVIIRLMDRAPNSEACGSDGWITVNLEYDPSPILFMGDLERKLAFLGLIERAMEVVERCYGMDAGPVLEACQTVRRLGCENLWVWKRRQSASRMTAEVTVAHSTEEIEIYLTVYNRRGQMVARELAARLRPWSYMWPVCDDYLGSLTWDGDVVTLAGGSRSGFRFSLDVATGEVACEGDPEEERRRNDELREERLRKASDEADEIWDHLWDDDDEE